MWTPLFKLKLCLAGLKVGGSYECSDDEWDEDQACKARRTG